MSNTDKTVDLKCYITTTHWNYRYCA